jgi:hypothetical protein
MDEISITSVSVKIHESGRGSILFLHQDTIENAPDQEHQPSVATDPVHGREVALEEVTIIEM